MLLVAKLQQPFLGPCNQIMLQLGAEVRKSRRWVWFWLVFPPTRLESKKWEKACLDTLTDVGQNRNQWCKYCVACM